MNGRLGGSGGGGGAEVVWDWEGSGEVVWRR